MTQLGGNRTKAGWIEAGIHRGKQLGKRLTALALSVILTVLSPTAAWAAEHSGQGLSGTLYQEQYVKGLMERYQEYIASDGYLDLIEGDFIHTRYMKDVMEQLTVVSLNEYVEEDDSWAEKVLKWGRTFDHNVEATARSSVVWAARMLTDKGLNQEAYEQYLMNLLAMQEKGYSDTMLQQAEYTAAVDTGQNMKKLGWLSLKTVVELKITPLNALIGDDLWKNLKEYEQFYKRMKFTQDLAIEGADEITMLCYLNLDKRRKSFLSEVSAYADQNGNKKLGRAAEAMEDLANLRMAGIVSELTDAHNVSSIANSISEAATNDGFLEVISNLASKALRKGTRNSKLLENAVVRRGLKFASYLGPIAAGLEIGGLIGSLMCGSQYEWTRETTVMYELGNALKSAHMDAVLQTARAKNDTERYEAVCRLVATGETLCLALCRGEYAVLQYASELRESAEGNFKVINALENFALNQVSSDAHIWTRIAEKKLADSPTIEEYEEAYRSQADRINGLYQSINAIIPAESQLENNGHTVVGYNGDIYYIRYNNNSFCQDGFFCYYTLNQNCSNQLVCREKDGSERVICSGDISGNIYIWKDRVAVQANDMKILLTTLDKDRDGEAGKRLIKECRIEGIDEVNGRLICGWSDSVFSIDMETGNFHSIRDTKFVRVIGTKGDTVYMSEESGSGGIRLVSANSAGEDVRVLGSLSVSSEWPKLMGGIMGTQITDDSLYAVYGYIAGTGSFWQEGAIVRADLNGNSTVKTLLDVGEVSAPEFFVEPDDNGRDVLYYVNTMDQAYATLEAQDAFVHNKGLYKRTADGSVSSTNIPVSFRGDTVYLDGAMKRRMDGDLTYTALVPATVINSLAECQVDDGDWTSDATIVHDVELVGDTVYFSMTYNVRDSSNDFGWRPAYIRRYTRVYQMELGGSEAQMIYQY